jgi:hypothetical protein
MQIVHVFYKDNFHIVPHLMVQICELGGLTQTQMILLVYIDNFKTKPPNFGGHLAFYRHI